MAGSATRSTNDFQSLSTSHQNPAIPNSLLKTQDSRIYILGTGSVGKFIAHSLYQHPDPPPITLLFHRPFYVHNLPNQKCHIDLTTSFAGPATTETSGPYDAELIVPQRKQTSSQNGRMSTEAAEFRYARLMGDDSQIIRHLIVCVKAHQTVSALEAVKRRLSSESTVLFLQNGMGSLDEVKEKLWPNNEDCPEFVVGVNSHGVHQTGPYSVEHAGAGVIYLAYVPHETGLNSGQKKSEHAVASPRYLINALTRVPVLIAVPLPHSELYLSQLEKLAVNAVLNPLTVLLDCRNGEVLHNYAITRVMRLLLHEFCHVFLSQPIVRSHPNAIKKLDPSRLEDMVVSISRKTAGNISSMLQDVRRGMRTEVDYINGYVVRKGEEVGLRPVMHYLMMNLVKGKTSLISNEVNEYAPFGTLDDIRKTKTVTQSQQDKSPRNSDDIDEGGVVARDFAALEPGHEKHSDTASLPSASSYEELKNIKAARREGHIRGSVDSMRKLYGQAKRASHEGSKALEYSSEEAADQGYQDEEAGTLQDADGADKSHESRDGRKGSKL